MVELYLLILAKISISSMIPFLKSVARAYAARYTDLSEFCFLFPNKRGGTFFLKYLKEEFGRHAMIAPEIKTITELVGDISGLVTASRLDQLFILYDCYRELSGVKETDDEKDDLHFDSFITWGETVLNDFNEVDLYLADPDEVFKNVKDFREISSNFLTEEQKSVMLEYFGRADMGDASRFWKNFDSDDGKLSEVKRRFLYLWRVMAPLYRMFKSRLEEEGMAGTGGMYRAAAERIEGNVATLLPYKKIVVIGFNALTTAEHAIFRSLKETEGYPGYDEFADFFWDATGPVLSKDINSASKFVKSNINRFPCPEWALPTLRLSDTDKMPEMMRVAASPSNIAQVKIAGKLLARLRSRISGEEFKEAKVAVVLPDENLLLPMLYSLPGGMGDVNLTMGYPLRLTSVIPFVTLLRRLVVTMRKVDGKRAFFHRDLKLFMAHPFSHACFTTDAINFLNGYMAERHKAVVTVDEIAMFSPKAAAVLDGLDPDFTPEEAIGYLDSILRTVAESLPADDKGMVKSRLEISHINVYRDALRRLSDILAAHGISMKPATVYRLADRLIAGETVGFEGEPLTGLQVMGMLETRSIDFEHIFILSANEKVLPMRQRTRSFIPDSLRHAFGMPPANYAESIFAYYFYRMISRAKGVTMIYDARSGGGMRSGDISRYILQLRHLFAKDCLKEEDWKFILSGKEPSDPSVEKTPEILSRINLYSEPDGKKLSASSLQAYRECQVKFFYQSLLGISSDPEPSEFIDAIVAGNILHEAMQILYLPDTAMHGKLLTTPLLIQPETIRTILKNKEHIDRIVRRIVNKMHFGRSEDHLDTPLSGSSLMVARHIAGQATKILRHDLELAPFKLYGCEIKDNIKVELPSGRLVNFTFAIDRLDEITIDGQPKLRIVDYKTGSLKLEAGSIDEVFRGDWRSEQIFQLFTYAWLLGKYNTPFPTSDVRMEIYDAPGISSGEIHLPKLPLPGEDGEGDGEAIEIDSFKAVSARFSEGMESMIESIFTDPEFKACAEGECGLCAFRALCRR